MKTTQRIIATLSLSLGLIACGGSADTDLEVAFCSGLGAAPAETVIASAGREGAPLAPLGDQATEVTLVPAGGQNRGSIVFEADEAGHFAFGLDADVPFAIHDASGQQVAIEKTVRGSEVCTDLAVRHTAMLDIASYTLTFGPADAAAIRVVAEESNDDLAM